MNKYAETKDVIRDLLVQTHNEYGHFAPIVAFARGGEILSFVKYNPNVTDDGVYAISLAILIGAAGFDADEVLFAAEGVRTKSATNPLTGKDWTGAEAIDALQMDGGLGGQVVRTANMISKKKDNPLICSVYDIQVVGRGKVSWSEVATVVEDRDEDSCEISRVINAVLDDDPFIPPHVTEEKRKEIDLKTCSVLKDMGHYDVVYLTK